MQKRENEIYLQILELIEKEYDKIHSKQIELKEETEQYGSKKEISKTEIKKRLEEICQTHTEVGALPISKLIIAQKISKVNKK